MISNALNTDPSLPNTTGVPNDVKTVPNVLKMTNNDLSVPKNKSH